MPTPVITHGQLGWAYQTNFLNNVKPKATFLTQLFFGGRETILPTETVELSYRDGERVLAPFVEVNAEAIPVGARSTTFANVSTPNIRIKRAMEAFNVFLRRQPGTNVFINNSAPVMAARTQAIAEDLLYMSDMIDNRLEWMVGQLISGTTDGKMVLAYEVQQNANWRIEIPRATNVDITLTSTARWAEPVVSSTADLMKDFLTVKRLTAKHVDSPPTVCVMDSIAADGLLRLIKSDAGWRDLFRDASNISTGDLNLQAQFGADGAIYHGRFMGVPLWEYGRTYVDEAGAERYFLGGGTSENGLAIFAAQGALNDSTVYYGAIPDHGAFESGMAFTKRFGKSWKTEDPSSYTQLTQTRPLPFIRRPNAVVVMDVG